MRIPRSVSGKQLARALEQVGYQVTRQTGSHMRLTCNEPNQHHITIPNHDSVLSKPNHRELRENLKYHGVISI